MTNDFSVTLTYRQRGTHPPLFVAGSFSDPPWAPQEMDCTADASGEMTFSKTCVLKPGADVQYKFRVGTGDWWVVDESSPTARDPQGNVNNVMRVPSSASDLQDSPPAESDLNGGRPQTSTSATFEGGENGSMKDGSTTNLIGGLGKGSSTHGATLAQASPRPLNDDVEGARGQSELRRRNGPRTPAAADDSAPAKTRKRGWVARFFRRIWASIGSFFRKLFRKNTT